MKRLLLIVITCLLCTNSYALSLDVHAFQNKLKRLGYYSGVINGKIDKETLKAIKLYRSELKTCPTYIDQATCTLILEFQKKYKIYIREPELRINKKTKIMLKKLKYLGFFKGSLEEKTPKML